MTELKIDRSRLTHKQANRLPVMQIELELAQRNLDPEAATRLLAELDALIERIVVSIPEGWLPTGMTIEQPGWLGELSQEHYETIMAQMQLTPGKKTD